MKILVIIVLYGLDFLLTHFTTMFMWNNIISSIFEVKTITMLEAVAISFFISWFKTSYDPERAKKKIDWIALFVGDIFYTLFWLGIAFIVTMFI